MSTMIAFLGSVGSSSPNALPCSFSYWPTPGNEKPPKVGDSLVMIWILVIRASTFDATSMAPPAASTAATAKLMILRWGQYGTHVVPDLALLMILLHRVSDLLIGTTAANHLDCTPIKLIS